MSSFLSSSDWTPQILQFSPQGSWAHHTIIKPPGDKGFDADLVVFVASVDGWSANDYLLKLREVFSASGVYGEMVGLRTRCVTLNYAGDFELDVVPCVVGRPGTSHLYEVCNRRDDQFEPTDCQAYTNWLNTKNAHLGGNRLREVTRLLKYLRDIKLTFSCKSILLTTLLGNQATAADSCLQVSQFGDLPTALKTLIGRLDDYLQARPEMHEITNPVLPAEHFVRHWDDDKYATFRDMIHKYRSWIDDAYAEADTAKSIEKWQAVFGDGFGGGTRAIISKLAESDVTAMALGIPYSDAVEAVKRFGIGLLARVKQGLPWVKQPQWHTAANGSLQITATAHQSKESPSQGFITTGQVLPKNINLRFEARGQNNFAYSSNGKLFDVQWQIVNTDAMARRSGGLRGGFYKSDEPGVRWESTLYRGVHWIQAFVIRRRDRACVARSERFFVVIE